MPDLASSEDTLDQLLLAEAASSWRKMARIVGYAMLAAENANLAEANEDALAERIRALVNDGRLQSVGDLNRMGFCELRLPPPP